MVRALLLVACFIAFIFAACGSDGDGEDDGDGDSEATTPAETTTPETTPSSGTPSGPTPTLEGFTIARQALDAYIRNQLGEANLGRCPQDVPPGGQPPDGICTTTLFEGAVLTTYALGVPLSEGIGELVLTRDAAGQAWTATFVPAPVLGEQVAVGKTAVVFGAGDCLRFRQTPALNGQVATCQLDGTTGAVVEGPTMAGGITWWRLEGLGWASGEFLGVAAE